MKNKYIRLIVIAYIAINILGVIVYYVMPKENFMQAKAAVDINQLDKLREEIWSNPQVLGDKSVKDKYNIKNYNFNYEGKELEITFVAEAHQIFIDRKTSDDNKIEVYWYSGAKIARGIDFGSIVKVPDIELVDNNLNIQSKKQKYSFTQFSRDSVINQFYERNHNESNKVISRFESGIIYIKIPKNLKVLGDEGYQYINN